MMLMIAFLLGRALGLPEVEDPIPDTIGFGHVIACAGAGGVVGEVVRFGSTAKRREQAARRGLWIGFWIGSVFYAISLVVQVVSGL
ncbi:MAG TPA: hypothetical protein VIT89_08015 [Solirubrobacterales bacterium]